MDVEKSNEIVDKIDKVPKRKKQRRRLEEFVGGRPKTVNPCTFVRPMRYLHVVPMKIYGKISIDNGINNVAKDCCAAALLHKQKDLMGSVHP
ncbi:hypothetical protein Tco_0505129 [Tanacetum coccineum]